MNTVFLDASALVKRYLTEVGSSWVAALTDPAAGNAIVVAEITKVEVAAALAARHRAHGGITRAERDAAIDLLLRHCLTQYALIPVSPVVVGRAVELTQGHRLRGYDAVQLAAALVANDALSAASLPPLTFVAADTDLTSAARAEVLSAEDPNHHP